MSKRPNRKTKSDQTKNGPGTADSSSQQREDGASNGSADSQSAADDAPFAEPSPAKMPTGEVAKDLDPASLRKPVDHQAVGDVEIPLMVRLGKPRNQEFVFIPDDPELRCSYVLLKSEKDGCFFGVHPDVAPSLGSLVRLYQLYAYVTDDGLFGLWPIGTPMVPGRENPFPLSAREIVEKNPNRWLRVENCGSMYGAEFVKFDKAAPDFSEVTLDDLLRVALKGQLIDSVDHPVARRLLGFE